MIIQVDWYKKSGKWYAGSKVEIGDAPLHLKGEFMQAVVDGQNELIPGWTAHGEFTVVTSAGEDAERFVNALFPAHEWTGMRKAAGK